MRPGLFIDVPKTEHTYDNGYLLRYIIKTEKRSGVFCFGHQLGVGTSANGLNSSHHKTYKAGQYIKFIDTIFRNEVAQITKEDPESKVWKLTSLSHEDAVAKFGKENVRHVDAYNRSGEKTGRKHVHVLSKLGEEAVAEARTPASVRMQRALDQIRKKREASEQRAKELLQPKPQKDDKK